MVLVDMWIYHHHYFQENAFYLISLHEKNSWSEVLPDFRARTSPISLLVRVGPKTGTCPCGPPICRVLKPKENPSNEKLYSTALTRRILCKHHVLRLCDDAIRIYTRCIFSLYGIFENSNVDPKFDISVRQIKYDAKTRVITMYKIVSLAWHCAANFESFEITLSLTLKKSVYTNLEGDICLVTRTRRTSLNCK